MKKHRTMICIGACAAAIGAVPAAPAFANSLLSGYGGPGQGNQAILGSALINGPGGNGGGSGGAGSGGSRSSGSAGGSTAAEGAANAASGAGAGSGAGREGSAANHGSSAAAGKSGNGGGKSTRASIPGTGSGASSATVSVHGAYPTSERVIDKAGSGPLGLSGSDFLYILLGVGLLAFMGVLTRRLSQASAAGSSSG